jgi:hypothetical protein
MVSSLFDEEASVCTEAVCHKLVVVVYVPLCQTLLRLPAYKMHDVIIKTNICTNSIWEIRMIFTIIIIQNGPLSFNVEASFTVCTEAVCRKLVVVVYVPLCQTLLRLTVFKKHDEIIKTNKWFKCAMQPLFIFCPSNCATQRRRVSSGDT